MKIKNLKNIKVFFPEIFICEKDLYFSVPKVDMASAGNFKHFFGIKSNADFHLKIIKKVDEHLGRPDPLFVSKPVSISKSRNFFAQKHRRTPRVLVKRVMEGYKIK